MAAVLNGALFNRIGPKIAEHSYIKALYSFFADHGGKDGCTQVIRITKRSVPTNTSPASSNINPGFDIKSVQHRSASGNPGIFSLIIRLLYGKYLEQISEAYKPLVFKPPV